MVLIIIDLRSQTCLVFSAEKSSNNSEQDMSWIMYTVMCKDL